MSDHTAEKQRAAEDTASPEGAAVASWARHIFTRIAALEIKQHRHKRDDSDDIARRHKGDRPNVVHADTLGDKSDAPDGGGHEQQETVKIGIFLFRCARHATLSLHKTGGPLRVRLFGTF